VNALDTVRFSIRRLVRKILIALAESLLAGCARTTPGPLPIYWVSSDSSQYSPSVRALVATSREGRAVVVVLDSGVIAVPGRYAPDSPVMMRNLYLTAYIAAPNTTPVSLVRDDSARFADRRGWRAVAESDSVLVATQLRFGERVAIRSVRLPMSDPSDGDRARWLVLGISGQSVDLRMQFDETGGLRAGSPGGRRLQVYACGDRNVAGQVDTARSRGLRRAYGVSC
jgi:hypothetical protein